MSIRCITAVVNYPLMDVGFKAVLFALANRANEHDCCWPSLSTLEKDSGAGRRTVIRKLLLAEELGIIAKRTRLNMSTVYEFDRDFLVRHADRKKDFTEHYEQSAKEVNPEPHFLHLFDETDKNSFPLNSHEERAGDPGVTVTPPGFDPSDNGSDPSDSVSDPSVTVAPKPSIEPTLESSLDSSSENFRKESTVEQFHRRWNELAEQYRISRCVALDENMRKKVLTRLDGFSSHDVEPCEVMDNFFKAIERSPFLRGEVPPSGGRKLPFRLSIGWALAPTNFAKIYNNSYDGDRDEQGRDISGPKAVGPTAAAAANVRARFRSRPQ